MVRLAGVRGGDAARFDSAFGPDVRVGWPHRLTLLANSMWLIAVAATAAGPMTPSD